jgi:hypothetical protein
MKIKKEKGKKKERKKINFIFYMKKEKIIWLIKNLIINYVVLFLPIYICILAETIFNYSKTTSEMRDFGLDGVFIYPILFSALFAFLFFLIHVFVSFFNRNIFLMYKNKIISIIALFSLVFTVRFNIFFPYGFGALAYICLVFAIILSLFALHKRK